MAGEIRSDKEMAIRKKISYAAANAKTLSLEELKAIHDEALSFGNSLPLPERGAFFWESSLETLGMIVEGRFNRRWA